MAEFRGQLRVHLWRLLRVPGYRIVGPSKSLITYESSGYVLNFLNIKKLALTFQSIFLHKYVSS